MSAKYILFSGLPGRTSLIIVHYVFKLKGCTWSFAALTSFTVWAYPLVT